MKNMILRLRSGGRLIGSWRLPSEKLEMILLDGDTGKEIANMPKLTDGRKCSEAGIPS